MIVIALLATLPLSLAHAVAEPQYKEIQLRQITQVPGAATTTGLPTALDTSLLAQITECVPPTSLLAAIPTDIPTPPPALGSFLDVTNPCSISVPQSLSSAFNSYYSAVVSWEKANGDHLSSYASAISSFEASVNTNPACASYSHPTYVAGTTGLGVCTAVTSSQGGSTTGSTTGSSSGSSSSSSSKSSASNNPATSRETTILLMGTFVACFLAAVVAI